MIKILRLIIEGYGCNDNCYSLSKCKHFISEVLNTLDITYLGELDFVINNKLQNNRPGISLLIAFVESHLALDTWPEENKFVTLEISSCKDFNKDKIAKAFNLFFKPQRMLTKKG